MTDFLAKKCKHKTASVISVLLLYFVNIILPVVCFMVLIFTSTISSDKLPYHLHIWYTYYIPTAILFTFILSICYSYSQVNSSKSMPASLLRVGISLLITGLFATILIIVVYIELFNSFTKIIPIDSPDACNCVNVPSVPEDVREHLNIFLQMAFNFLLGGVGLIGASLPVLQSLFRQETSQPPQCSGESGGSRQDK